MQLADKYIFKKILLYTSGSILIFTAIFSLFKFIEEIERVGRGNYDIFSALWYTLFLTPSLLPLILFVAVLTGIILAIGNMHESKNFLILQFASYSPWQITLKVCFYVFVIFTISFIVLDNVSPYFQEFSKNYRSSKIGENIFKNSEKNIWFKESSKFIHIKKNLEGSKLEELSYFEIDDMKLKKIVLSDTGRIEDGNIIQDNVSILSFSESNNIDKLSFSSEQEHKTNFQFNEDQLNTLNKKPHELNLIGLSKKIIYSIRTGIQQKDYFIELVNRILLPVNLVSLVAIIMIFFFRRNSITSISSRIIYGIVFSLIIHFVIKILTIYSLSMDNYFLAPQIIFASLLAFFSFSNFRRQLF